MNRKIKVSLAQYPILKRTSWLDWKTATQEWVKEASAAQSELCVFPEYGSIELTGFAPLDIQNDLKKQIQFLSDLKSDFIHHFSNLAQVYGLLIVAPSIPVQTDSTITVNRCYVFSPSGKVDFQDKIYMTRFEDEQWGIQSARPLQKIFQYERFTFSISICFDVEFPFPSFLAAANGAEIMIAPSCTETVQGMNRVHIGARARALENQVYVLVAQTVGEANWSVATDINTGMAAAYGPPDLGFSEDGIVGKGLMNQVGWQHFELDLDKIQTVREQGAVFNFKKMKSISLTTGIQYEIRKI